MATAARALSLLDELSKQLCKACLCMEMLELWSFGTCL